VEGGARWRRTPESAYTFVAYLVFVHEWTQIIDGTIAYMPLSKDLTRRTAEPTTIPATSWCSRTSTLSERDPAEAELTLALAVALMGDPSQRNQCRTRCGRDHAPSGRRGVIQLTP
jgi:hypothetical protein